MKTILCSILFVFAFQFTWAQPTTETEYNYMKKGYRQVEESGLDVKNGYYIQELTKYESGQISIRPVKLFRADSTFVGYILKCVSDEAFGSGTNYYVIPSVNLKSKKSYGWDLFSVDLTIISNGMRYHILQWMAYRLVYETNFN